MDRTGAPDGGTHAPQALKTGEQAARPGMLS